MRTAIINMWQRLSVSQQQWLWFVGLWCFGLVCVGTLAYAIRLLMGL